LFKSLFIRTKNLIETDKNGQLLKIN